jgi:hypothetical protein
MPEVPPVMTTVLFSNVFIGGAQGSPNRRVGQLADNMGRVAYAGAVAIFSRGQPLHTGMCGTPAELERRFRQLLLHLKDVLSLRQPRSASKG